MFQHLARHQRTLTIAQLHQAVLSANAEACVSASAGGDHSIDNAVATPLVGAILLSAPAPAPVGVEQFRAAPSPASTSATKAAYDNRTVSPTASAQEMAVTASASMSSPTAAVASPVNAALAAAAAAMNGLRPSLVDQQMGND